MARRHEFRRRITATGAVLFLMLTTSIFVGVQGASAGPASVTRCSSWEHETSLPTGTTWGRLMDRVCIRWIPNGNQVRAEGQIRVDWPAKYCDPPFSSIACVAKIPMIKFDEMRVKLDYALPSRLGPVESGVCKWGAFSELPPNGYLGAQTRACHTGYRAHPWGTFFVRANVDYRIGGNWYSTGNTPSDGAGWWSVNFPKP
jgi:hypothetical protein